MTIANHKVRMRWQREEREVGGGVAKVRYKTDRAEDKKGDE